MSHWRVSDNLFHGAVVSITERTRSAYSNFVSFLYLQKVTQYGTLWRYLKLSKFFPNFRATG